MNRVALVTGGGRGIGRGIALQLAHLGFDVAVVFRRDAGSAAEVCAQIAALGRRAEPYQASVERPVDVAALAAAVLTDFGHVDVLVSNAVSPAADGASWTPILPSSTASWPRMSTEHFT